MKKIIILPLALVVLVGALWASSIITPDKPGFPSNPQNPGTLGYILSLFGTDGTARDSLALGGVSATGYLQASNTTCTNPGEVWKGMNTDGTVECGTRGTLLAIGRFSEISGAVEVSTNGTSWIPANTTDTLSEGTIVRTTSGTGTIAFVADDSVLRLDTNTVVQLQSGDLGGNTVAQAILADGRLWGRVLTSTGVNIGGGGLIAGVRGTSISIAKSGNNLTLDIIDSVSPTAATIINKNSSSPNNITIGSGQSMTYTSGATIIGAPTPKSKATLLTDTWIRQNTLMDIAYLNTISDSTSTTSEQNTRIVNELAITEPSPTQSLPICITGKRFWKGQKDVREVCQDEKVLFEFSNNGEEKFITPTGEKQRQQIGANESYYVYGNSDEQLDTKKISISVGTVTDGDFWKKAKIQINEINISNITSNAIIPLEFDREIKIQDIKFVGIDKVTIEKWGESCPSGKRKWDKLKDTGHSMCQDNDLIAFADFSGMDKNLYFNDGTNTTGISITGVNYGGNYTITTSQKNLINGKTISFSFPNGKVNSSVNQYLFYAKVDTVNYSRYLNTSGVESSPTPSPQYAVWDSKFPYTSTFQLGYGTIAQALQSPMRIEFR